jgi:hypothetical protein
MKMKARNIGRQPEGPFVAEEMNFIPPPDEFLAESGGQNAAAADGGITCDADFHFSGLIGVNRR